MAPHGRGKGLRAALLAAAVAVAAGGAAAAGVREDPATSGMIDPASPEARRQPRAGTPDTMKDTIQPFTVDNERTSYLLPNNFKMTSMPKPDSKTELSDQVMDPETHETLTGRLGVVDPLHDRILKISDDFDPLNPHGAGAPTSEEPEREGKPPIVLPSADIIKTEADA